MPLQAARGQKEKHTPIHQIFGLIRTLRPVERIPLPTCQLSEGCPSRPPAGQCMQTNPCIKEFFKICVSSPCASQGCQRFKSSSNHSAVFAVVRTLRPVERLPVPTCRLSEGCPFRPPAGQSMQTRLPRHNARTVRSHSLEGRPRLLTYRSVSG